MRIKNLALNCLALGALTVASAWARTEPPPGVMGPASSTTGHCATFADGTGKHLTDGGIYCLVNGLTTGISQTISTTWSGGYPGTGNIGLYSTQSYTGTPSSDYADPSGGHAIPLNFFNITSDTLTYSPAASYVIGLAVRLQTGGTGASGARLGFLSDFELTGPISTPNSTDFYSAAQFSVYSAYNVTGATSGAPLGNFYGFDVYASVKALGLDGNPIYAAGLAGGEIDYTIESGGWVKSGVGLLIVNESPSGTTEQANGAGIVLASAHGSGWLSHGLFLGNEATGNTLPVVSTGSLIGASTGSVANGVDFSQPTFSGCAFKGPNSFCVANSNTVSTDTIEGATGSTILLKTSGGATIFSASSVGGTANYVGTASVGTGNSAIIQAHGTDANVPLELKGGGTSGDTAGVAFANGSGYLSAYFSAVATAVSYPQFTPAASGNSIGLDVGGTNTSFNIAGAKTTILTLANASATTQILGTIKGAAGSFTANGSVATAMTSLGPAGSHATVQEWFTITDTGGTVRYIPAF